jgi:hypothetical protein
LFMGCLQIVIAKAEGGGSTNFCATWEKGVFAPPLRRYCLYRSACALLHISPPSGRRGVCASNLRSQLKFIPLGPEVLVTLVGEDER